jgi:outer membrane protein
MNKVGKRLVVGGLAAAAALSFANGAAASDWIFRAGGHYVDPKSDNHAIVNVDSSQSFTFSATRFLTPNWGIELLAALPFEHDIKLNSTGAKVAEVKHLPPTLSVQYHFLPDAKVRPYIGAGLNATIFFDEKTQGALAGSDLSLDTSFGFAAQAGLDFDISKDWFVGLDARWMDIDTDAKLSGTRLGQVSIDPFAIGLTIGHRF